MKKTLVLGASINPHRYSYTAIHRLRSEGHEVIAVGRSLGTVADVRILDKFPEAIEDLNTISVYLKADLQTTYYTQIIASNPKRIIFNPGAENIELARLADSHGINTIEACTLVMLSIKNY